VAGRRRAVLVAIAIAAITLSVIPFAATSATAPPGINRFLYALGQLESGGNYYARNPYSGAYGKYQIMPSNWPVWAKLYVGSSTAKQTPLNQEKVARGKVTALWNWLDSWENVGHWWLTGSGERNQALWSSYSRYYVAKLMKIYNAVSETTAALDVMAAPPPAPTPVPIGAATVPNRATPPPAPVAVGTVGAGATPTRHRIAETNGAIAYGGRWADARYATYAGGHVLYSETNGATATYTFQGTSISWVGPVGPTRGRARVTVDGKLVTTVNLYRSGFHPRVTIFDASWKSNARHTLQITVVGSGRPVAIDELLVTR